MGLEVSVCHYAEKREEVTPNGKVKKSEKEFTHVRARVDHGAGNGMAIVSKSF